MFTPGDDPLTVPCATTRLLRLLIYETLFLFTSALHSKRRENYLTNFKNRVSLSAMASSDSQITSATFSVTLVQVLPRVNNSTPMQIPYSETRRTPHPKWR